MFYGINNKHDSMFLIGAIYKLENNSGDKYYTVMEGNCDCIRKDCVVIIDKEEYDLLDGIQQSILQNKDNLSENAREYVEQLYKKRNILK